MECPNCKNTIELTRMRYLKSPFSRFVCDSCSTKFTFKRPASWYVWATSWGMLYGIALVGCIMIFGLAYIWLVYTLVTLAMLSIYVEIDRKLESAYPTRLCDKP